MSSSGETQTVKQQWGSSERWIIGPLLSIGLLAFFLPLATFHIPIVGDQSVSGYDLIAQTNKFDQMLDRSKAQAVAEPRSVPSESVPINTDIGLPS